MASSSDLIPLRKTLDALKEIRRQLLPFLKMIERGDTDESTSDPHTLAEAKTAVALAVGTLRHMGARLGGKGGGGTGWKNDPLRLELDRMRKMLVTLRKIDKRVDGCEGSTSHHQGSKSDLRAEPVAKTSQGDDKAEKTKKISQAKKEDTSKGRISERSRSKKQKANDNIENG